MKKIVLILTLTTSYLHASVPAGVVKLVSNVFATGGQAMDVKVQPDGKIVSCGFTLVGNKRRSTVVRLLSNGEFDDTFNGTGIIQSGIDDTCATGIAITPDGTISVLGYTQNSTASRLDSYSGTTGALITGVGFFDTTLYSFLVTDKTNTYFLGGPFYNSFDPDKGFLRGLYVNQSDYSYSTMGNIFITGSNWRNLVTLTTVNGVAVTASNKVLFGVSSPNSPDTTLLLSYASPTGPLSGSKIGGTYNYRGGIAIDELVYFSAARPTDSRQYIYRIASDLSGETAFNITANTANTFPFNAGGSVTVTDTTLTSSLMVCACSTASSLSASNPQPFIARFKTTNNTLDTTFGSGGIVIQDQASLTPGYYASVAQQPDGKTITAGFSDYSGDSGNRWILARYNTDGTLDPTFKGPDYGILQDTASPFNNTTNGFIYTTTVDASGNLVAGGQYDVGALTIRYTGTGGRDGNSFGNNGVANLTTLSTTATVQRIILSGAGYLAAGVSSNSRFTTFKLTSAGVLDTSSYGAPNGYVVESTLPNSSAYDILVTGTGILSVAGVTNSNKLSVINYGPNGVRNSSIGNNGLQLFNNYGVGILYALQTTTGTMRYGAGQGGSLADTAFVGALADQTGLLQDTASPFNTSTNGFIYTSTIDQSGTIVVGGQYNAGALSIRYTTSAGRDGTFGSNGVANLTALNTTAAVQKIINSGTGYLGAGVSNTNQFTTFKLTSTGSFDTSYNTTGTNVETTVGVSSAYDILVTGGLLSVAGVTSTNKLSVINYNANGTRNSTIGNNGLQTFNSYGTGTLYALNTTTGVLRYGAGQGTASNIAFVKPLFDQSGVLQDTASPFSSSVNGFIYTTTIDQSGKIVVGGQYNAGALTIRYTTSAGRDGNTFGNNGVANLTALNTTATVQKIINSGTGYLAAGVSNTNQFTTFKLTSAGAFDTAYNTTGTNVETTVGTSSGYDILVTGTGLLSVSGVTNSNNLSVINYGANGIRNSAVGTNGLQVFSTYGTGTMYAVNTNGSIRYGAGQGGLSSNTAFVNALINRVGMLQDTVSPFNNSTNGFIVTSTIDQSGNIVVGGQYDAGALSIRYTTSAGRDGNFGNNGVANLNSLSTTATVQKIITSGTGYLAAGVSNTNQFTTFKLTDTGGFATAFNGNGVVVETTVGVSAGYDLLLNGTALAVAGFTQTDSPSIINYQSQTGARNTEVGTNGIQEFPNFGTGTIYALQTTIRTFAAGQGNNAAFVKQLLDATGILQDTASPFDPTHQAQLYGGIVDSNGNLVLCGVFNNIFTVIRYTADGERDNTFGIDHNGVAQYNLQTPSKGYSVIEGSDGNYYVAGEITVNATTTLAVFKYTNDGLLDTTFGTSGITQGPSSLGQSRGYSLSQNLIDGSLLVAGQVTVNAQLVPAFVLYDASGDLVTEFGRGGIQTFSGYGPGSLYATVTHPTLYATGAGGISARGTIDTIATLVQIGQGSEVFDQIETGF